MLNKAPLGKKILHVWVRAHIKWALGEAFAFGLLLIEGFHVRLNAKITILNKNENV